MIYDHTEAGHYDWPMQVGLVHNGIGFLMYFPGLEDEMMHVDSATLKECLPDHWNKIRKFFGLSTPEELKERFPLLKGIESMED